MKKNLGFIFLFALILSAPARGFPELGLGPPFTHFTLTFVSGDLPREGITAVLVDESKKEWTGVSDQGGQIQFAIQAGSGTAFLTYWKDGSAILKKALPYHAGNHYNFRLELNE